MLIVSSAFGRGQSAVIFDYEVTNDGGILFADEYERLGGVDTLGHPASYRFTLGDGFTYQVTQRALLQWRPEANSAYLGNIFQMLEQAGLDEWLLREKGIPLPIKDDGAGGDWNKAKEARLSWLTNEQIKAKYLANPNPSAISNWSVNRSIELYGLPMSRPERFGPFISQRFQRVAFQFWVEEVPGSPAPGTVIGVLAGDLLKEAGLVPPEGLNVADGGVGVAPTTRLTDSDAVGTVEAAEQTPAPATRLTDNGAFDSGPAWSPDGRRIAFNSNRDGNWEVYVMNADGSGVTRLTDNDAVDGSPTWSPDGTRIAFDSTRDGDWDVYVMNADGSGVTRLTDNDAWDWSPAWSPNGRHIAFHSNRDDGNWEIYVMNADGSGVTRLTYNGAADFTPAWSPDSRRIAFGTGRHGKREVYVIDASGVTRLTFNDAHDVGPAWSPDGRRIAFASERDGNLEIYVMNADGSGVTRLTDNGASDLAPAWSPDGRRIAFHSNREDGNWDIYVMNAAGEPG